MGIIVSSFPGCGRSFADNQFNGRLKIINMKVSDFEDDNFPNNYVDFIVSNIDEYDIIFITSNNIVLNELENREIHYDLFYPEDTRRTEFIENFISKHLSMDEIRVVDIKWFEWLTLIKNNDSPFCHKHVLGKGQFIANNNNILQYVNSVVNNPTTDNTPIIDDEVKKEHKDVISNEVYRMHGDALNNIITKLLSKVGENDFPSNFDPISLNSDEVNSLMWINNFLKKYYE